MSPALLSCDSCRAITRDTGQAGAWFVFNDAEGPGNARCPDCLPDASEPFDLSRV